MWRGQQALRCGCMASSTALSHLTPPRLHFLPPSRMSTEDQKQQSQHAQSDRDCSGSCRVPPAGAAPSAHLHGLRSCARVRTCCLTSNDSKGRRLFIQLGAGFHQRALPPRISPCWPTACPPRVVLPLQPLPAGILRPCRWPRQPPAPLPARRNRRPMARAHGGRDATMKERVSVLEALARAEHQNCTGKQFGGAGGAGGSWATCGEPVRLPARAQDRTGHPGLAHSRRVVPPATAPRQQPQPAVGLLIPSQATLQQSPAAAPVGAFIAAGPQHRAAARVVRTLRLCAHVHLGTWHRGGYNLQHTGA